MTATPALAVPRKERLTAGLRRRVALTGVSLGYVLLAPLALVVLCLVTTSVSLVPVGVGLVLLLALVPLTAQLAGLHRRIAGRLLGVTVPTPYAPDRRGSWWSRLRGWAADPARWRDLAWTYVSVTLGWTLAWLGLGLGLAVVWYAAFPAVFALTPDGTLANDYGFVTLDTQSESFLQWVLVPVALAAWWWLEPLLVRWIAQLDRAVLAPSRASLERRVAEVSQSRAESIDHSAAELRRIERDLHDGAQARLVALGMNLGLAAELLENDPDAAARLLAEARTVTTSALGDLRSVVRGIHPPVLADRGLAGAIQALALDMSLPVSVTIVLPGRPPAPVESAVYFATSELLANAVRHASARRVAIDVGHDGRALRVVVTDDGVGGAAVGAGSGLTGVARRLAAFDGTMDVVSPAGGPTTVSLEVPCALSSPRTSPSSATD
ncbi:histidine kinase [Aeromicrobium sp. Root472D3]|uniref:sensor histidine kinase n=1 Tax=Aeromicrobium sp. Root472D3 TaxID=1736540 RepID=UPI0009EC354E|nr:histidine kinase [Aeromicrobium sp. Root472D3]